MAIIATAIANVPVRVRCEQGIDLSDPTNTKIHFAAGTLITLPPQEAMQLFRDGKVSLEEFRPPGAPMHAERR